MYNIWIIDIPNDIAWKIEKTEQRFPWIVYWDPSLVFFFYFFFFFFFCEKIPVDVPKREDYKDHAFTMYAKFSEILIFFPPDTHT